VKKTEEKSNVIKKRNIVAVCVLVLMVLFLLIFPNQPSMPDNNDVDDYNGAEIGE